jgi:alkanesulfonate monooxygenase SsuD/methylene tetrahydromethanopterin reductase-like flavin-dependent oxidoreductase (luciferase family)
MAQVQFGLSIPISNPDLPRQKFLQNIHTALDTIAGHFDSVWLPDHLQFGNSPLFEGWTMLTYLAALRPELRYGHLVLCQLFRNPALLAKMAATFQYMSQGHFILGIGAGWAEEEAKAYHIPFPPAGQRVSELEEQLQIIKALWREDNVTFEGKYHQVHNAYCLPHPEPLPPVLIAGFQPRMMRLVAHHADWWNTVIGWGTEDNGTQDRAESQLKALNAAKEQLKALDAACEQEGRDPKTLRRTAIVSCSCATDEQKLKVLTTMQKSPLGQGLVGTPSQVVEQLQPFIELGFDYFIFHAGGVPYDFTTIELLSHEVLPALNKRS